MVLLRLNKQGSFFTLAAIIMMITGCSRSSLQSLERAIAIPSPLPEEAVRVNFCTDTALDVKSRLKYLIIFDHSGSNQRNYKMNPDGSGAPLLNANGLPTIDTLYATDPRGQTRYGSATTPGTLLNFLSTAPSNDPANPSRWYSMVNFSDKATSFPVNGTFTSDTQAFYRFIQTEAANTGVTQDVGNTSYTSALSKAYETIRGDVQYAKDCSRLPLGAASPGSWCPTPGVQISSTYVIIFMSDGSPITRLNGLGVDANGNVISTGPLVIEKESTNQILGLVNSINALQADTSFVDSVNLFTIYYYANGNVDRGGETLLQQMARAGNGVSYSALANSNIDYTRFTPPGKLIKNTLSDIFVTNASLTFWKDGVAHLDSDMDGIPDDVEKALGSDAFNSDSDGNGISDFVEYQLNSGKPCKALNLSGHCTSVGSINYLEKFCAGVGSSPLTTALNGNARPLTGAIQFKNSDPSGLNDCEKKVLNNVGGINNPDSNGDLIPDWLEFKNGVSFQLGSSSAAENQDPDGYSYYKKIKSSLPALIPYGQILNPQASSYKLEQVSTSILQDCYRLAVTQIPVIGSGNTVRVDVMLKSPLVQNNLIYRVGKKSFLGSSKELQIDDWNDSTEKVLGTWSSWP